MSRKLLYIIYCLLICTALGSCGEFWEMETASIDKTSQMGFVRRTVTIMEGECYAIPLWFVPDSLYNKTVFWETEDKEVVTFVDDTLHALTPGLTRVIATSTFDHLSDTCWVEVMKKPQMDFGNFPYEMLIYASVTLHGQPLTIQNQDSVIITAYSGSELRGIGTMRQSNGIEYMMMRAGGYTLIGDNIRLRCYYKGKALAEWFPTVLPFDGESHGTLSNLLQLTLDDGAEVYQPDVEPEDDNPYIIVPDTIRWEPVQ